LPTTPAGAFSLFADVAQGLQNLFGGGGNYDITLLIGFPYESIKYDDKDWKGTIYPASKIMALQQFGGGTNTGGTQSAGQLQQSQNLKIGLGLGAAALTFLR